MRLAVLFLGLSLSAFAEPPSPTLDLTAEGLKQQAKQLDATAGFAKQAEDYETQTNKMNEAMDKLRTQTGLGNAPKTAERAPASNASGGCSSVDSWASFKGCIVGLFDRFNGTPEIAKELKSEPAPR